MFFLLLLFIHPLYPSSFCRWSTKHMQMYSTRNTGILTHTFPGGDESCQQLAEVGPGVFILLSQRKSFQLGGRAAVLDMRLSQGVDVSREESCSTQTNTREQMSDVKTHCDIKFKRLLCIRGLSLPAVRDLYLQKERTRSAGPRRGAWRRRGAPNSSYTGLPARHTHTALQSSITHTTRERGTQGKFNRKNFHTQSGLGVQQVLSSPDSTAIFHTKKLQLRPSAICQTAALSQLMITVTAAKRRVNQSSIFTPSSGGKARNTRWIVWSPYQVWLTWLSNGERISHCCQEHFWE